jgi:tetratricopeptide (TPR) repeat protein
MREGTAREEETMSGRWTRITLFVVVWIGVLLLGAVRPALADEPLKDPAAVEAEARAQLEKTPADPELHFKLGNALYDQGRRDEAQASFEKALALKPDFLKAVVNLGVVLNESGKSEEALKYFETALALSPKDVTVLCNKGQALYALRKYQQAVDLYRQSIDIDPKAQLPHYLLGVAFADAGIYREAIVEWNKVVQLDPSSDAATTAQEGIKVLRTLLPPEEQKK